VSAQPLGGWEAGMLEKELKNRNLKPIETVNGYFLVVTWQHRKASLTDLSSLPG
jgi:hypothetical protein